MTRHAINVAARRWNRRGDHRGQTEVIGVVLVVAIVVLGTIAIVTVGGPAVSNTRDSMAIEAAEHSLSSLDSRASGVAFGDDGTGVQRVDLGGTADEGAVSTTTESWIRVDTINATTGAVNATVVNESMGAVVYRNGDTTVAYEGGGVWRGKNSASSLVSPPEFHFRNNTLTLPIVSLEGDPTLTRNVQVRRDGAPDRRHPDPARNLTNRVPDGKVTVTVHSDYYQAWGRYFEQSTKGYVTYDHGARTATVTFLALPKTLNLRGGIIATASSGELKMDASSAYTDSYDSRTGPYDPANPGSNGTVEAVGDVEMAGGSEVLGDVRAGKSVDMNGNSSVTGTVYWTDNFTPSNNANYGAEKKIDGVSSITPIDGYVHQNVAQIRATNDNANSSLITSDNFLSLPAGGPGTPELGAGTYYLTNLTLVKNDDLNLNTTGGDITIAVRDYITVTEGSNLGVTGNGNVRIFVAGEKDAHFDPTGGGRSPVKNVNLGLGKRSAISVPGDKSTQLVVYGTKSFSAAITGSASKPPTMVGVIYAPAGNNGTGAAHIMQGQLYGAIVTGSLTVGSNGQVHYDQAVGDFPLPRSPTVSRIEFMHVGVHNVTITN